MEHLNLEVQHRENSLWKKKLEFWSDELDFYIEQLDLIMKTDGGRTPKRLFLRVNELKKERKKILEMIDRSERDLMEDAKENKVISPDHDFLRYSVQNFEKNYDWIIKHEMKRFLSSRPGHLFQ